MTELKIKRKEKDLTQKVLAAKAKIALRTYKYYEAGTRTPNIQIAQRIAQALGVTVDDLYPMQRLAQ